MPPLKRATPLSPENVRGTDIHGKAVVLAKTQPQQLALFQYLRQNGCEARRLNSV